MFIERRDKDDNYYKVLQSRTLDLLQRLSGNVWTDFNVHDPGITIADIFNYALYELHYIFQSPFESYFDISQRDEATYYEKGFFTSGYIFSDSIVTVSDYRKLITDTIKGIEDCSVSINEDMLYKIEIQLTAGADEAQIKKEIEILYHSNRNLCEHLGEILVTNHILSPEVDKSDNQPQTLEIRRSDSHYPQMLSSYYSIQNHFPECYGIGERGFSSGIREESKVQILQLKAYLLIFDYLLADTENQAKNIRTLLDLSKGIPRKEALSIDIKDFEKIVDKERMEIANIHSNMYWHIQKSRFLDVLDSIYGENTKKVYDNLDLLNQNKKRADIIPFFPALNKNRFRSFNILNESDGITGIRQTISAILGFRAEREIPISNIFAYYNLRLLEDRIFFTKYKYKQSIDIVEDTSVYATEMIQKQDIPYRNEDYKGLSVRISILWHNLLYEAFMVYGANINNYRLMHQQGKGYVLIFKVPKRNDWLIISRFYEKESLVRTANLFCQFIKQLNVETQTFYLIEHILLNDKIDYNKLTVVIPRWTKGIYSKIAYEKMLMARFPAHLAVEFVWFSVGKMYRFENIYYSWRKAMADRDKSEVLRLSRVLKNILNKK